MTVPQASVLGLLGSTGGSLPITEIGKMLMLESQSTTALIDRMSAAGLVERVNDPRRRRAVLVKMTDKGARMNDILATRSPAFTDEMFGILSSKDRLTLAKLLHRLVEHNIKRLR